MAVPKKKTSYSRNRMRSATKFIREGVSENRIISCTHCGEGRRSHHICAHCGYYNGKSVIVTKAMRRAAKVEHQSQED